MENEPASKKKSTRMRLWHSYNAIVDHELSKEDTYSIYSELNRKIQCLSNSKPFEPDISKNTLFSQDYQQKEFDIHSKEDIRNILFSVNCRSLRSQSFYLLDYFNRETKLITKLKELYEKEENEKDKKCLFAIIMQKQENLDSLESIRGFITEIFTSSENAWAHLEKCFLINEKRNLNQKH